MLRHHKTPNYIFFISAVLIAVLAFFIITVVLTPGIFNHQPAATPLSIIKNTGELISNNLVSFKPTNYQPTTNESSPVLGDAKAPITIFEFSGFDCPVSAQVQPVIKQVLAAYPSQVKIVWKDLPLDPLNPEALLAHQAGRCAQKQNKFWQYHDLLFANQQDFSRANLLKLAKQIKLDSGKFTKCLDSGATQKLIDADMAEADNLLIPGTPHFYIGESELLGLATFDDFKNAIEQQKNVVK